MGSILNLKTITVHEAHEKTGLSKKEIHRLVNLGIWDSVRTSARGKIHIIEASIETWYHRQQRHAFHRAVDPDAELPQVDEPRFN